MRLAPGSLLSSLFPFSHPPCAFFPHPLLLAVASGVPAKELCGFDASDKAVVHGIKTGVVIDVRRGPPPPPPPPQHAGDTPPSPSHVDVGATGVVSNGPWTCSACTFLNAGRAALGCEVCGTERPVPVTRHVVPADNTCLFTAVGFCVDGGRMDRGAHYRTLVADAISSASADLELSEAELGQPPEEYAAYMRGKDVWGGGIELAVLAKLLRTEVCAVEIRSGRAYNFGEGRGYPSRILLVFDGVHYDALVRQGGPGGRTTTVFPIEDEDARVSALALAAKLQQSRAFVDLAGFTLRCGVCSVGLQGEVEALHHARATGHTNFSEYKA